MTPEQDALLKKFAEAVLTAPAHYHLTSDRDFQLFWNRHIQDAIKLHDLIPAESKRPSNKILDIGSGNGIPGIPISILEPNWEIDLLDSDNKKCGFLDAFCKSNAINNVHVIADRAEALAKTDKRASYYMVFARALSKLRTTLELAGAFLKVGGLLIVPHGTTWEAELEGASNAAKKMGLKFKESIEYKLGGISFWALQFLKVAETPNIYPRDNNNPVKRPL